MMFKQIKKWFYLLLFLLPLILLCFAVFRNGDVTSSVNAVNALFEDLHTYFFINEIFNWLLNFLHIEAIGFQLLLFNLLTYYFIVYVLTFVFDLIFFVFDYARGWLNGFTKK